MSDLVALKKACIAAQEALQDQGLRNAHGRTVEELIEMDIDYEKALAECVRADRAYREALKAHL